MLILALAMMALSLFVFESPISAEELCEPAKTFELLPGQKPEELRDAVRAWRQEAPENQSAVARVLVHEGTWFLPEPIQFGPEDSHTQWVAQGNVVWTRGREITGWSVNEQGYFVTKIDAVAQGTMPRFDSLFVNDRRAILARTPNDDYFYIQSQADDRIDPATGEKRSIANLGFIVRESERPLFNELAQGDLTQIKAKLYHSWSVSNIPLAVWNSEISTAELIQPAIWNLDYWGRGSLRYRLSGFKAALDMPGEFFLDTDGTLTYIPREGESLDNFTAVAPVVVDDMNQSGFMTISGNLPEFQARAEANGDLNDEALYVTDLSWTGFHFACDAFALPKNGLAPSQAANNSPSSITINVAKRVAFNQCSIRHIGAYALYFHLACSDCLVEKTLLEDLGAGGVRIGAGNTKYTSIPAAITRNCILRDSIIRGYGQVDESAVGVWIGHSPDNQILHNDISEGYYTGVSVGWVWGYGASIATGNIIEYNTIHHIGQGVLSDMGGVYTLGISPGTSVSNNVIHDVWSYLYGYGGWGLYTDEGSSDILFENNLVYRVRTGTIHQHYGKNNLFRNNILAFSQSGQLQRSREEEHLSFTIERNIILWDRSSLFTRSWPDDVTRYNLNHNLYWFCGPRESEDEKESKFFGNRTLAQWQELAGRDEGSLLADPGFVDAAHNDFHFVNGQPNAAVQAIGFVPFNFEKAGLSDEAKAFFGEKVNFQYRPLLEPAEPPKEVTP